MRARAALAALALAAAAAARANDVQRCKVKVQHGTATVEVRQARDTATEVTGRIRPLCRAEVRVTAPGREPAEWAWKDLQPSGGRFGVALLPERPAGLSLVAKYGDHDGRLLLVAKDGRTLDVPGPEHVVQGRWLVTVGASDVQDLAVVDLASLQVTDRREYGRPADPASPAQLPEGEVLAAVRDERGLVLVMERAADRRIQLGRLDERTGRLVVDPGGARPAGPDLLERRPWSDCSCEQPSAAPGPTR